MGLQDFSSVAEPSSRRHAVLSDGYWIERGVVSQELVLRCGESLNDLAMRPDAKDPRNLRYRHKVHPQSTSVLLDSIDPICDLSPAIREVAASAELKMVLQDLLGGEVCL